MINKLMIDAILLPLNWSKGLDYYTLYVEDNREYNLYIENDHFRLEYWKHYDEFNVECIETYKETSLQKILTHVERDEE